jgi:hypothetical protein
VPRRLKQACGAWPVGAWLEVGRPCRCTKTRDGLTSPFTVLLVEIGPEGCTPTQQSPFFSHSPLTAAKGITAPSAKKEDAKTK